MKTYSSIEVLEPRIAPAGIVSVLKGGTLFVTSAQPVVLFMVHTADGNWGVRDFPDAQVDFANVRNIQINLTGVDNEVQFYMANDAGFPGTITLNSGSGDDIINVQDMGAGPARVGTFKINGGTGNDRITIANTPVSDDMSVQDLVINGGPGLDQFEFGDGVSSLARNVTLTDTEESYIEGVVNGFLTVKNRGAVGDSLLRVSAGIGGKFTYFGGDFEDEIDLEGGTGGELFLADLRGGDNEVFLYANGGSYPKTIIKGGSGNEDVEIDSASLLKGLVLLLKDGNNTISLAEVTASGPVVAKTGLGTDDLELGETRLLKGGVIAMGDGLNTYSLVDLDVVGSLIVNGGNGSDQLQMRLAVSITKNFVVGFKAGDNSVMGGFQPFDLILGGNFVYSGGIGADNVDFQGGTLSSQAAMVVKLGDGANQFAFANSINSRSITVLSGSGADVCYLIGSAPSAKLTVKLGAGNDYYEGASVFRTGIVDGGLGDGDDLDGNEPTGVIVRGFEM